MDFSGDDVGDAASLAIEIGSHRTNWTERVTWRCDGGAPRGGGGCALADVGNGVCDAACNVRACSYDGVDCDACPSSAPRLRNAALEISEDARAGDSLRKPAEDSLRKPAGDSLRSSTATAEAMTLEVQCASAVDFDLVDVESPTCAGRGAPSPFELEPRSSKGFELVVAAGDGASLDREACDEYHVRVNATNARLSHEGGSVSRSNPKFRSGDRTMHSDI